MVDVTNRANVDVRFGTFKLTFCHLYISKKSNARDSVLRLHTTAGSPSTGQLGGAASQTAFQTKRDEKKTGQASKDLSINPLLGA
jgi:hypothetical protein